MTWDEKIQKRRKKENELKALTDVRIPAHLYLYELGNALSGLSDLETSAIVLRFVDALPIARIADRMGMSWDGVDWLIDKAIPKLRKLLKTSVTCTQQQMGRSYEIHCS